MKKNTYIKSNLRRLWLFAFAVLLTGWASTASLAQVSYSYGWEPTGLGSWTGGGSRTTTTPCTGTGVVRYNLYSFSPSWNFTSPNLGTSMGGLTTVSFSYKILNYSGGSATPNSPSWGSVQAQWANSATGPWTTFKTIDNTSHVPSTSCSLLTQGFSPAAGPLYIRFSCAWSSGDYYIYFDNVNVSEAISACAGPLAGGTTTSSANPVCTGAAFTLGVSGASIGSGLTYLWESADDLAFTSNVQSLGTAATQAVSQTATKYYRRTMTCTGDASTATSSVLEVTMNSLLNCYCPSTHSSGCSGDAMTNVVLNTLANNTGASCPVAPAYTYYFPGVSQTSLYKGASYTLTISFGSDGNQYAGAWIDFNADGLLDAGENIGLTGNAGSNGTVNINFTVPAGATTGLTRLRIVGGNDSPVLATQACGASSSSYGETEDYDITLSDPPPCSGTPASTTALASAATICPGGASVLSLSGLGIETGFTYQWEESSDDINWVPVSGADQATYAAAPTSNTYFHCIVTCSNSGLSTTSSSVLVSFDGSADAGIISGPTTGVPFTNLVYSTGSYLGDLQWQVATALGGPYSDVSGATLDNVSLTSNGAGSYFVRLRAASVTCTTHSNIINVVISIQNDNVCNAFPLTAGATGPYTNIGATGEVGEPVPAATGCAIQTGWCENSSPFSSVWFAITAPASGKMSIRLNPAFQLWDSQFALYSAASCNDILTGAATLIAANDDSSGSPYNSYIAPVCVTPGSVYYLKVDGYQTTVNGNWGLLVTEVPNVAPVISNCPLNTSVVAAAGICGSNVSWTAPTAADPDNCLSPLVFTSNYNSGDFFPLGTTTVTYIANDGVNPPVTCSFDVTVSPADMSTGAISGIATACLPGVAGSSSFSIPSVSGAINYVWSVPAGMTISSGQGTTAITANWTASAIQAGISGQICVYATDGCANGPATCLYVEREIAAPVTPGSISGPGKLCPGDAATYSVAAVSRATSYTWSVPANVSITGGQGTNVLTVSVGPGYTGGSVTVSAGNVCGSSPLRSKAVTVNLPGTPAAIQGSKDGLCNVSGQVYSVSAVPAATSYLWTVAGGTITGGQGTTSITVDFGNLTSGTVTVQAVNGCGSSLIRTLSVVGAPARPGTISGPSPACAGTIQPYSVATVSQASSYNWTVTGGGSISSGQGTKDITIQWSATPSLNQSVTVSASNACGTSAIRALSGISVNACPRIGDTGEIGLLVFPNPATDRITVEFTTSEAAGYRISITDLSGRTVYTEMMDAVSGLNRRDVSLNGYAAGMYFIVLESPGVLQQQRLVIE